MAVTIIDRTEQKYFLSNDQYQKLMKLIHEKLIEDTYFKETIYNIYFDNDEYELINRSISKPIYKEKIRLRCYELPNNDTKVFLEIKKKFQENSNKRRIELTYKNAYDFIENHILPDHKQITKEIDYCFKNYRLKPKIKILYDRLAYCLKEDNNFRITFDHNVRYNTKNVDLKKEDKNKVLFKEGYIMEVKTLRGLPIWLNHILLELKIYPTSYSKVGKIFEQLKESEIYVS